MRDVIMVHVHHPTSTSIISTQFGINPRAICKKSLTIPSASIFSTSE